MNAMKKLISLAVLTVMLLSMCSCSFVTDLIGSLIGGAPLPGIGGGETPEINEEHREAANTINKLATAEHTFMKLDIYTIKDDVQLASYYRIDTSLEEAQVEYSVQTVGTFREENGVILPPESFIVTHHGVGELMQGRLISLNGDPVNLPYVDALKGSLYIDLNTCANIQYENDAFFAFDCYDPYTLLGTDIASDSVRVNIKYSKDAIHWMSVDYITYDGVNVSIQYSFN